jgi:hypothetical protein
VGGVGRRRRAGTVNGSGWFAVVVVVVVGIFGLSAWKLRIICRVGTGGRRVVRKEASSSKASRAAGNAAATKGT